jgi:hypothetical protein
MSRTGVPSIASIGDTRSRFAGTFKSLPPGASPVRAPRAPVGAVKLRSRWVRIEECPGPDVVYAGLGDLLKLLRNLSSLAIVAMFSLCSPPPLASCTASVLPIFQCGFVGWFAPPPPASGTVSSVWWQLGYGNNRINNGCVHASSLGEGNGLCPAGVFSGNDSGLMPNDVALSAADVVLPQYAAQIPEGSLCLNFEWSWAAVGVDGCADDVPTSAPADDDNLLNPYWGNAYGPCSQDDCPYETTRYLIDYPMAVLLRESTNRYFALAFVANHTRHENSTDISEGFYDLGEVRNGDLNPVTGKHNIVPWQPVPRPHVDAVVPVMPSVGDRIAFISWQGVRLVHDQSTRPNPRLPGGGVGILEQIAQTGGLCRYQVQTAPWSGEGDSTTMTWSNAGAPIPCNVGSGDVSAQVLIPPDPSGTALRVRTLLGKQPRTASTTLANTRVGASGDLGFEATSCLVDTCVNSPPFVVIPGPLISEQAVDTVAERNRNAVLVRFRTTSELTVTGIDILGRGETVVASVPCRQCTSGVGDAYEVLLTPGDLKGARALRVRVNGPDTVSEAFPVDDSNPR